MPSRLNILNLTLIAVLVVSGFAFVAQDAGAGQDGVIVTTLPDGAGLR